MNPSFSTHRFSGVLWSVVSAESHALSWHFLFITTGVQMNACLLVHLFIYPSIHHLFIIHLYQLPVIYLSIYNPRALQAGPTHGQAWLYVTYPQITLKLRLMKITTVDDIFIQVLPHHLHVSKDEMHFTIKKRYMWINPLFKREQKM